MGYALAMSAEIRAWLDELQAGDPAAAGTVGQAVRSLAERGPALGPPLVRPVPAARPAGADPREALSYAAQERAERLAVLRRHAAEATDVRLEIETRIAELESTPAAPDSDAAATLARGDTPAAGAHPRTPDGPEPPAAQAGEASELKALLPGLVKAERRLVEAQRRMQADLDMFRVRKETLGAAYTAAEAQRRVAGLLAGAGSEGEDLPDQAGNTARMAEVEAQIDALLSDQTGPPRLLELRPGGSGAPGGEISLIFAIEPPGTALLISVVHGEDALRYEWQQAAEVAADVLSRVRAGQDPGASAIRFRDAAAFAADFAPAGAAAQAAAEPDSGAAVLDVPWLPFPLLPQGRPACQYQLLPGGLELTGAAGTDLFIDPAGAGRLPEAGFLAGTPPPGDFTLSARVSVRFGATFDAGVLLVHAGERRWAKLCFELSPQHKPTAVTVVTKQTSDDCNSFEVTGDTVWLRICRTGRAWAFHASTDGQWWRLVRYFDLGADAPARVGFLAQSPTGPGCTASFASIAFRPGAPADLRDGS